MKYLMLVCRDASIEVTDDEHRKSILDRTEAWVKEMDERGVRVLGDALQPPPEARTVRARGGGVLVTDGPFAETKEHIAGFDVLECASLDEAVEVASKHPVAELGALEVRAFWEE